MLVSGFRVCTVLLTIYLKFIMSLLFILLCSNPVGNQCNCVREHSALDDYILRWSYQVWYILYCLVLVLLDISVHFPD